MRKEMKIEHLTDFVKMELVFRIFITENIDGTWLIAVDHKCTDYTPVLYTQRNSTRIFKTADAAIRAVKATNFKGPINITLY